MSRFGWASVLGVLVLLGAGCDARAASPGYSPGPLAASEQSLMGVWRDRQGRAVPDGTEAAGWEVVLRTESGSPVCSAEVTTVFLELAWPIGRSVALERLDWGVNVLRFVRDSERLSSSVHRPADLDVRLPTTAVATGFHREGNTISVDQALRELYVTRPDGRTERWARLHGYGPGCG